MGKENTYIIQLITFSFEELRIHAFYQSDNYASKNRNIGNTSINSLIISALYHR